MTPDQHFVFDIINSSFFFFYGILIAAQSHLRSIWIFLAQCLFLVIWTCWTVSVFIGLILPFSAAAAVFMCLAIVYSSFSADTEEQPPRKE